jgi:hypothetical protein
MPKRKRSRSYYVVIDQETGASYTDPMHSIPAAKQAAIRTSRREVYGPRSYATVCVYHYGARGGGREVGCAEKGKWFTR